jgi:S-adenosylmethionine hydrolase
VTYLWSEAGHRRAVRLEIPAGASATFHGRDLFAPVAARLAAGAPLEECGTASPGPRLDNSMFVSVGHGTLSAQVVCVDHFGNAITSLRRGDLPAATIESIGWPGGRTERMVRTYDDIGPGLAGLWNSAGHLEIAAMQASAATVARLAVGTPIVVRGR